MDNCTISDKITSTATGFSVSNVYTRALGKRRQAAFSQKTVKNGYAVFNLGEPKQVIETTDSTGVAINPNSAANDMNVYRCRVGSLVFNLSLGSAENVTGNGIDRHEKRVTDQRKVMGVFLGHCQPIVKFHKTCQPPKS
ncbi:hypothetical protein ALQ72_200000 [Pseudomonas syringae pv. maculicola]|nr:hypothetical protein ALQ72_200000 [Pseudomonas syringae pv. maculicola]